jgi:ABC-type nitrate/sulfonate/bicarbonate transport system permease component
MENKWLATERVVNAITMLVLVFAIWHILIKIDRKQAATDVVIDQANATLEQIRQQMKDDQKWQKAVQSLEPK